ncbi:hypothetical protein SAMN05421663_104180 [Terribacillus halophilus]|uniref:Uncharacterized protein n=1 Tax=Terribacillus halophilus TaxID=361279 RepID=A0A1G6PNM6_9BACI|nr:hypothetical protein [Terribacillus halophilus]SDC81116.1 hypothetical protein SAMN05421663_104180 [Terribacillus halophilus]
MKDIILNILTTTLVSGIITAIVTYFLDKRKAKAANAHTKSLQVDSFVRSSSGEEMRSILDDWRSFLFDIGTPLYAKKLQDPDYMRSLINRAFMYSSAETIRRLATYQNFNYRSIDPSKMSNDDKYRMIVMVAGIIVSLKKDFSDENVDVRSILKLKLTDFDKNSHIIDKHISDLNY